MKEVAKLYLVLRIIHRWYHLILKTKLKHLQLIPLDTRSVMLIIVTDANIVTNNVIRMDIP